MKVAAQARWLAWIVIAASSLAAPLAHAADPDCLTQSATSSQMWWPRNSVVYYEFAANVPETQRSEITTALVLWTWANSVNSSYVSFQPRTNLDQYPILLFSNSDGFAPASQDALEQVFRYSSSFVEIVFYPTTHPYFYNGAPWFFEKIATHAIGHTMGLADQSVPHVPENAALSVMNVPTAQGDSDNFMAMYASTCDMNTISLRLYPENDYGLSAPSITITAGRQQTIAVQTWVTHGGSTPLNLGVTGRPSGVTAAFSPSTTASGSTSALTITVNASAVPQTKLLTLTGINSDSVRRSATFTLTIEPPPAEPPPGGSCPRLQRGLVTNLDDCTPKPGSPIVLDLDGDGFALTAAEDGVAFDLFADGRKPHVGWTTATDDDAWLVLDRNGNGAIDDGRELFGDATPQPPSDAPNGFEALAVFDAAAAGGNGDGWISPADAVFARLRLWRDANHDGVSQPTELVPLDRHVAAIRLSYERTRIIDDHGNELRYRSTLRPAAGSRVARELYDVWLVVDD